MAKEDFCFTYYDGDAARDKAHMNRLERGAYDDIISAQRKRGHLTLDDIKKVLSGDFEKCWSSLEWILLKDSEQKYFIEWVDKSLEKMRRQSKSQKEKIEKYWKNKKIDTTEILQNNNSINSEEPLVNGDGNGIVNENSFEKSEKLLIVPEMMKVWKAVMTEYYDDQDKDFEPLLKISKYIAKILKLPDNVLVQNQETTKQICRRWGEIVKFISTENHFRNYSLIQVERHFQSILQKQKNGTSVTSKSDKPGTSEARTDRAKNW